MDAYLEAARDRLRGTNIADTLEALAEGADETGVVVVNLGALGDRWNVTRNTARYRLRMAEREGWLKELAGGQGRPLSFEMVMPTTSNGGELTEGVLASLLRRMDAAEEKLAELRRRIRVLEG